MVAFNSNSLLESPVVPVPRLLDPPTPSKGPRLLQLNYAMCLAKPLQRSTYMNGHVLSLVDVARIMSNLDLPLKTLPELETSSEIANASPPKPHRTRNQHDLPKGWKPHDGTSKYGIFRNLYIVMSVPLLC